MCRPGCALKQSRNPSDRTARSPAVSRADARQHTTALASRVCRRAANRRSPRGRGVGAEASPVREVRRRRHSDSWALTHRASAAHGTSAPAGETARRATVPDCRRGVSGGSARVLIMNRSPALDRCSVSCSLSRPTARRPGSVGMGRSSLGSQGPRWQDPIGAVTGCRGIGRQVGRAGHGLAS